VIDQILKIRELDPTPNDLYISFVDDLFTHDRNRTLSLCDEIIKLGFSFTWSCNTRVDMVDEELLSCMYRAGCRSILFGIETCDEKVNHSIGKRLNLSRAANNILIVKATGIRVREMFILGLPGETSESLSKISEFVLTTMPHEVRLSFLSVFPGTVLWERKEDFGLKVLSTSWSELGLNYPSCETSELPASMLYTNYLKMSAEFAALGILT
jgi:radical SAM superfamily enzyme YgiQ (UPF0313 family)